LVVLSASRCAGRDVDPHVTLEAEGQALRQQGRCRTRAAAPVATNVARTATSAKDELSALSCTFTVTLTNSSGSVTSDKVTPTVNAASTCGSSSGGGGGGGGGAMDPGFVLVLAVSAMRTTSSRRTN
jgi:hypothetical protein